jgi:hypothetical protein
MTFHFLFRILKRTSVTRFVSRCRILYILLAESSRANLPVANAIKDFSTSVFVTKNNTLCRFSFR